MQPLLTPTPQGGVWRKRTATVAAVVVLVVLVGSMVAIFTALQSGKNLSTNTTSRPTPTSTPSHGLGSTVYTSPASSDDFYAFAWSPDSKQIAASTQSEVMIWDATTGKHPLTYRPNGQGGSVLTLSWSPDGKKLAEGAVSSDGVEIIDPVTGTRIRTFSPSIAYQEYGLGISAAVSLSGGSGVSATAWSRSSRR